MHYESNNYLAHHGTLGQRWGVRNGPPYPLNEQAKKVLKTIAKRNAKKKKENEKRKAIAEQEAAERKAQKKVADHEKLKEHIRKHPKDMYKHRDELTREEAKELIDQIEWDREIADIRFDEFRRFNTRTKEIGSAVQNASNILNYGIGFYNNTALIYNALLDHQVQAGSMSSAKASKSRLKEVKWTGDNNQQGKNNKT